VDSIGHRRLRPESSFTFLEQAARFHREGYEPTQNLLSWMYRAQTRQISPFRRPKRLWRLVFKPAFPSGPRGKDAVPGG
jgi:hypothetical protein